jgi:hypothetical protein
MKLTHREKFIINGLSELGIVIILSNYIQLVDKKERKILYQVSLTDFNSLLTDLINPFLKEGASFKKEIKELKRISLLQVEEKEDVRYKEILDLWWVFIEDKTGVKPSFNPGLLKKAESIYNRMREQGYDHNETVNSFKTILDNYENWDKFEKESLNISVVDTNLHKIINKLKSNGEERRIGISEIRQAINYNRNN